MDYWDPAKVPGIRAMYNAPPYSLEFALIADGVPNGELSLFDASGHMPFVEEPDLFRATVAGFIDLHR
jgi:pimeloyl-ACP methyl ester carboxylesterase